MALSKCKECGKEVSTKADKCPGCGAPVKVKKSGCLTVVVAIFGLSLIGAILGSNENPNNAKMSSTVNRVAYSSPQREIVSNKPDLPTYKITSNKAPVHLGPNRGSSVTNNIYKDQSVQVYEIKGRWVRISQYYDGSVEGVDGQVARWIQKKHVDIAESE